MSVASPVEAACNLNQAAMMLYQHMCHWGSWGVAIEARALASGIGWSAARVKSHLASGRLSDAEGETTSITRRVARLFRLLEAYQATERERMAVRLAGAVAFYLHHLRMAQEMG